MDDASLEASLARVAAAPSSSRLERVRRLNSFHRDPVGRILGFVAKMLMVLAFAPVFLLFGVVLLGALFGPLIDLRDHPCFGEEARARIESHVGCRVHREEFAISASSSDFYHLDLGAWDVSCTYWSMQCASLDDCWRLMRGLADGDHGRIASWERSQYGVVMDGPGFYEDRLSTPCWDLRTIRNGAVFEKVDVEGERRYHRMFYYAIDFDTLRVYGHYESGGFSKSPPRAGVRRD